MKKIIFIILSFSLLNCNYLFGQDVYSYYQNKKVFYKIDNENIFIKFKESVDRTTKENIIYDKIKNIQQIIEIESIKGLTFIKHEELPSSNYVFQLLNSFVEEPDIEYTSPVLLNETGQVIGGLTDKFIVKLKPGVNFIKLKVLVEKTKTTIENKYPFDENVYFIRCSNLSNGNSLEMANEFYESGLFEYSEPDFLLFVDITTDDTYFDQQWGLNNTGQFNNGTPGDDIDAIRAWEITTGCSSVRIAIIDTGIDLDHEDLDDNLEPGFDATGGNSNGSYTGSSPFEGHGTCCAGIAAAEGDNNQGIAGVAYDCRIVPVRGLRVASGVYSLTLAGWLAAAIDWAWQNNRSDVISMSFRIRVGHSAISTAINNAVTQGRNGKGCILVASTGNENIEFIEFPASNANTIAVGATSMCEERKNPSSCDGENWGSNYGQQLNVVAPGVKIATTDIAGTEGYSGWDNFPEESKIDDEYIYFKGTSSAVPHVAGIAGLIFSFSSELTQAQVREIIESTTDKIGDYSYTTTQGKPHGTWNNRMGYGRVNAYNALVRAAGGPITGPSIVCTSNSTFTLHNRPSGTTVDWTHSGNLIEVTGDGTDNYTVRAHTYGSNGGPGWVQANITIGSCDAVRVVHYDIDVVGTPYVNPATIEFTCVEGPGYFCTNAFGNEYTFSYSYDYNYFDVKLTNLSETQTLYQDRIYSTWSTLEYWPPEGTYMFMVRGNNACGTATNWSKTTVDYVDCGGFGGFLSFFPNPATAEITMELKTDNIDTFTEGDKWEAEIFNRQMLLMHKTTRLKDKTCTINVSGWKEGIYYVRVKVKDKLVSGKFIVTR